MSATPTTILSQASEATSQDFAGLSEHLMECLWTDQREDGHWHYPLDDSITMNAEYIFFLRWMNENDEELIQKLANFILSSQRADGSWNIYDDGPGNLSASIEAYFALRLANISADSPALLKARQFILSEGGIPKARVFTKIWFSLFGLYPWEGIPIIPPEILLAPRGTPFHILEFSYWSRSVIIPLTILFHEKKTCKLSFNVDELYLKPDDKADLSFIEPIPVDQSWITKKKIYDWKWLNWEQVFTTLTQGANLYEKKMPVKPLRKQALEKARQWILNHQDEAGDWAGIVPAMMNSVMALYATGMQKGEAPVAKGMNALRELCRGVSKEIRPHAHEGSNTATLQSCVSPIWDSALGALALIESGVDANDPRLQKTKDWLWNKRITRKGDWIHKSKLKFKQSFACWAFQYHNDFFPDLDDTTVTTLVLHKLGMTKEDLMPAVNWMLGMQNNDGGWGTFDRENTQWILNEIPFADLKSLIDPSNPDCTGHVLETLGELGLGGSKAAQRASKWLQRTQRPDGSWFGRWGVHTIYGTCAAVVGLRKIGLPVESDSIERAIAFILKTQNADGGWGEACDNYAPNRDTGIGPSTPSQTAWALMSLQACRQSPQDFQEVISKGLSFLETRKTEDGLEEREFTGTGFPLHFYLRYDGYRKYFPLIALGRLKDH